MESARLSTQVSVYFRKTVRIAFRENCWKSVVFSVIIAFVAAAVANKDMFILYTATKSGLFTLASACIWIGIFNTIQSICKEHEIICADYRSGMKISAFVISNVLWQAIICLVQTLIIFFICRIFIDFNSDGIVLGYAPIEYVFTMFLLVFGSSMLGIMISSISSTPTTAMTIMPFVLIVQLILCGVLFKLDGVAEKISCITFSKWGMSAFGSIADMNTLEECLLPEDCYSHNAETLLYAWVWCIGISAVCILASGIILKIRNRNA